MNCINRTNTLIAQGLECVNGIHEILKKRKSLPHLPRSYKEVLKTTL